MHVSLPIALVILSVPPLWIAVLIELFTLMFRPFVNAGGIKRESLSLFKELITFGPSTFHSVFRASATIPSSLPDPRRSSAVNCKKKSWPRVTVKASGADVAAGIAAVGTLSTFVQACADRMSDANWVRCSSCSKPQRRVLARVARRFITVVDPRRNRIDYCSCHNIDLADANCDLFIKHRAKHSPRSDEIGSATLQTPQPGHSEHWPALLEPPIRPASVSPVRKSQLTTVFTVID